MKSVVDPPAVPAIKPPFSHEYLDEALGNAALEGLSPCPETLRDLRKAADGEMTREEYFQRLEERYGSPARR